MTNSFFSRIRLMVNIYSDGLIKKQALRPAVKILKTPDNTFL
jgi:hypothetical protein